MSQTGYLQKALGEPEDPLEVVVDVEDVLYMPKPGVANLAEQYVEAETGKNPHIGSEDFDSWNGTPTVAEKMGQALDWDEYGETFFSGEEKDGSCWPGFHEASDIVWTGEEPYEWVSTDDVRSPREVPGAKEGLNYLSRSEDIDLTIATSRTDRFSRLDVEEAITERLMQDFGEYISRDDIVFTPDKLGLDADVYADDSPNRAEKIWERRENGESMAVLVPETPQNNHADLPHVDGFGEAVDEIKGFLEGSS